MGRTVGTMVLVYGLVLAVLGGDTPTGLVVAFVGWAIRRYWRPPMTCRRNLWL